MISKSREIMYIPFMKNNKEKKRLYNYKWKQKKMKGTKANFTQEEELKQTIKS